MDVDDLICQEVDPVIKGSHPKSNTKFNLNIGHASRSDVKRPRGVRLLQLKMQAKQIQTLKRQLKLQALKRYYESKINEAADLRSLDFTLLSGYNKAPDTEIVIDSGTTKHLSSRLSDFVSFTGDRVRVRGVSGASYGKLGIFKRNILGEGVLGIYLPELPVGLLISTNGVKQRGWEVKFSPNGDSMTELVTGRQVQLSTSSTGLPCCKEFQFFTDAAANDSMYSLYDDARTESVLSMSSYYDSLPSHLQKSLHKTRRKRGGPPPKRHLKDKLLQHWRVAHLHEAGTNCGVKCIDCLESKYKGIGSDAVSSASNRDKPELYMFSFDIGGPVSPTSYRGRRWILAFTCNTCQFGHAVALGSKSEAPQQVETFIKSIREKCGTLCDTGMEKWSNGLEQAQLRILVEERSMQTPVAGAVRSDNAAEFVGKEMVETLRRLGVHHSLSPPYRPQSNSYGERYIQSIKSALRTCMRSTDPRAWCFALENIVTAWNLVKRKNKSWGTLEAPQAAVNRRCRTTNPMAIVDVDRKRTALRRWGCLAIFRPGRTRLLAAVDASQGNTVLQPRALRGMFLGFSPDHTGYRVGVVLPEKPNKLSVFVTPSCVLCEEVLVKDLPGLNAKDTRSVDEMLLATLKASCAVPRGSTSPGVGPDGNADGVGSAEKQSLEQGIELVSQNLDPAARFGASNTHIECEFDICDSSHKFGTCGDLAGDSADNTLRVPSGTPEVEIPPVMDASSPTENKAKDNIAADITYGPSYNNEKRPRGRPPGTKDKKGRVRRTKKQMLEARKSSTETGASTNNVFFTDVGVFGGGAMSHLYPDEDLDESPVHIEVFLSREADDDDSGGATQVDDPERDAKIKSLGKPGDPGYVRPGEKASVSKVFREDCPDRPLWLESRDVEAGRLASYRCWRKVDEDEYNLWRSGKIRCIPTVLLINRKRSGLFKSRLVVLGNKFDNSDSPNLFAGVVSQVGTRLNLLTAMRRKFSLAVADIKNAFIRASLDEVREPGSAPILISLPPGFDESHFDANGKRIPGTDPNAPVNGPRRVLQALYGLPLSPRAWNLKIDRDLRGLGWQSSVYEPGIYRLIKHGRVIATLGLYVDDVTLCAESKSLTKELMSQILSLHPGELIEPESFKNGKLRYDLLGADLDWDEPNQHFKLGMSRYCKKLLRSLDMAQGNLKPAPTPYFEESLLYDDSPIVEKPPVSLRAFIGSCQWLQTVARPDISEAVSKLARASCRPMTRHILNCCRRLARYISGTQDIGLEWSPTIERQFAESLKRIGVHPDNAEQDEKVLQNPIVTYGDASFGTTFKSFRSVTGVVVYAYGMPILWSSKPQTLVSGSTMEAEWIASSTAIEISEGPRLVLQFLLGKPNEVNEHDGDYGPIMCDNRSAVIAGRRGVDAVKELPRPSRHVALRHQKVLQHCKRVFFTPTDEMRADGLTKSCNHRALKMIFEPDLDALPSRFIQEEEEFDCVDSWIAVCKLRKL